ncbi:MAG: LysE family transporter [Cyanobacteria bacterium P01_F01_bin.53]
MLLVVLVKGILMGLAIAAPVGPIALLCIRRTLAQGSVIGLLTGLGAATADGLYGMVSAFGLTLLSNFLVDNTFFLQLIGGLFLCYLGVTTFLAKPALEAGALDSAAPASSADSLGESASTTRGTFGGLIAYGSTLFLTLTNPATIFSFLAIFAGLGITQSNPLSALTLVLGVFLGSALWWLVLVSAVSYLRHRLTPQRLARFNRVSTKFFGVLIFGFGVVALTALMKMSG